MHKRTCTLLTTGLAGTAMLGMGRGRDCLCSQRPGDTCTLSAPSKGRTVGKDVLELADNRRRRDPPPPSPRFCTGKKWNLQKEKKLLGHFLVHKFLGSGPPRPSLSSNTCLTVGCMEMQENLLTVSLVLHSDQNASSDLPKAENAIVFEGNRAATLSGAWDQPDGLMGALLWCSEGGT